MMKCPKCGKWNSNSNKFCGECGTNLGKIADYCPRCNKTFINGEKFCTECGIRLIFKRSLKKESNTNKKYSKPKKTIKTSSVIPNKHNNKNNSSNLLSPKEYREKMAIKSDNLSSSKEYEASQANNSRKGTFKLYQKDPVSIDRTNPKEKYSKMTQTELKKQLEYVTNKYWDCRRNNDYMANYYKKEMEILKRLVK